MWHFSDSNDRPGGSREARKRQAAEWAGLKPEPKVQATADDETDDDERSIAAELASLEEREQTSEFHQLW